MCNNFINTHKHGTQRDKLVKQVEDKSEQDKYNDELAAYEEEVNKKDAKKGIAADSRRRRVD
eukprot:11769479-Karenia_brevis.AAC.1